LDFAMTGQHDDVHIGLMLAHPPKDVSSIRPRHFQVGDDTIKRTSIQRVDAGLSVRDKHDIAAFLSEGILKNGTYESLIVYHENAHPNGHVSVP
jgi:hypothetical protein